MRLTSENPATEEARAAAETAVGARVAARAVAATAEEEARAAAVVVMAEETAVVETHRTLGVTKPRYSV